MSAIDVRQLPNDGDTLRFEVTTAGRTYNVSVADADVAVLAPSADPAALVEESFRFLLEREPASSILPSFDLSVIERYFPGYRREITARLSG